MLARIIGTFINIFITICSLVSRTTFTNIAIDLVETASMLARIRGTFINIFITIFSLESGTTFTSIVIDQVKTASMLARIRGTFINIFITFLSTVSRFTIAWEVINFILTTSMDTRIFFAFSNIQFRRFIANFGEKFLSKRCFQKPIKIFSFFVFFSVSGEKLYHNPVSGTANLLHSFEGCTLFKSQGK